MRCCVDLIKFLLFLANFLCFLAFAGLLAGTVYILTNGEKTFIGQAIEPSFSSSDPTNATYFSFIVIFLVIFSFFCIFTCLGCCGAACKSGCMLGSFIVILFVLFGGSVGAVVFLHTQFGWEAVREVLVQELSRNLPGYRQENLLTQRWWDWLQPTFSCCGVGAGQEAWQLWQGAELQDSSWKVPQSCCRPGQLECMYEPNRESTYTQGCEDKIVLYVQILFYGIPVLMFTSLVFAFIVSSSVTSAERRRKATGRGERERERPPYRAHSEYSMGAEEDFHQHSTSYPSAPGYQQDNLPYNPQYEQELVQYQHTSSSSHIGNYPVGTVPPPHSHVPLLHQAPPSYNEVVSRK